MIQEALVSLVPLLAATPLLAGDPCDPRWIPTFGSYPGASAGRVEALAVFDDGSGSGPELYAGGSFVGMGVPASRIARWNGERWAEVGGGVSSFVQCLQVFDDGSGPALYVGGSFTSAGGQLVSNVARWDGTSWSDVGGGTDGAVFAFAVHDDGSGPALYAGGAFASAGGVPANSLARWDGTSWSAVGGGVAGGAAFIEALAVHDDGGGAALYAGGDFASADGAPASNLARWDGDAWSAVGGGTNGRVHALLPRPGAALYVGGDFLQAGGVFVSRVARWEQGTWSALGSGANGRVECLAFFDDGTGQGESLFAGGQFSTAGGVAADSVARWDGQGWSALGAGLFGSFQSGPLAFAAYDDGAGPRLVAGGSFTSSADLVCSSIARWDGAQWGPLTDGLVSSAWSVAAFDDGSGHGPELYAAGFFGNDASARNGVARWRGGEWQLLAPDLSFDARCLVVHDDGSGPALFVGGNFSNALGNHVARWDGAGWSPLGGGLDDTVLALHVHDDGTGPALFAGGRFTLAGGVQALRVAKWDGAGWSALGLGMTSTVRALTSYEIGGRLELVAGGDFTSAGGQQALRVARWDGQRWRNVLAGVNLEVRALEVYDDGSGEALYVGGDFTMAGGQPARGLARWSPSGGWTGLPTDVSTVVYSLQRFDAGDGEALFVGGGLSNLGGELVGGIARWDGAWSSLEGHCPGVVRGMGGFDVGAGPSLYVAGYFPAWPGGDAHVARWACEAQGEPGLVYCACDGGGAGAPCGNAGDSDEGCLNSSGVGGELRASGSASASSDDLVLTAAGLIPNQPGLLFAGSERVAGGAGAPFGDGLRCAGGMVRRLGVRTPDASGAASWGPGLVALGGFSVGATRRFQVWYRDAIGSPCGSGFNLTNGYELAWLP